MLWERSNQHTASDAQVNWTAVLLLGLCPLLSRHKFVRYTFSCVTKISFTKISCCFVCWKSKIRTTNRTTSNGVVMDAINFAPGTPGGAMSTKLTWCQSLSLFIGSVELLRVLRCHAWTSLKALSSQHLCRCASFLYSRNSMLQSVNAVITGMKTDRLLRGLVFCALLFLTNSRRY